MKNLPFFWENIKSYFQNFADTNCSFQTMVFIFFKFIYFIILLSLLSFWVYLFFCKKYYESGRKHLKMSLELIYV